MIHGRASDEPASAAELSSFTPAELASFVRSGTRVRAGFGEQLRAVIMLGRPRTCVPGLICYALGHSYTGASFSPRVLLVGFLSFLIGFSGNLHNAYTDIDEDSRNMPGRLVLIAKVGYRQLFWISTAISIFMVVSAAFIQVHLLVFMLLAVIGMLQYSFPPYRAKDRPIWGLWVFSNAVVFPFIFGWGTEPDEMLRGLVSPILVKLTGAEPSDPAIMFQSYRFVGMVVFLTLWFMAKGTFKNVPDFYGDLAAGVRTSATACRTWRNAALVTTAATVGAYLSLIVLVLLGLESPRLLLALVWLVPITANCVWLVRANSGPEGNRCLKLDMMLSSGFIASVLLLIAPSWEAVAVVSIGALLLFGSDLFGIDSRRNQDVPRMSAAR